VIILFLGLKTVGQNILRHFKKLITGKSVRLPQHGPWEFKKFEIVHKVIRDFEAQLESQSQVAKFKLFWKIQGVLYSPMTSTAQVVVGTKRNDTKDPTVKPPKGLSIFNLLNNYVQKVLKWHFRNWVVAVDIEIEEAVLNVDINQWYLISDFSQYPDDGGAVKDCVRLYWSDTNDRFKTSIKRYRTVFEDQPKWNDLPTTQFSLETKNFISQMPLQVKQEIVDSFRGFALAKVDSVTEEVLTMLIVKPGRTNSSVKEVSF
jgi:hypothetical protein